VSADAAWEDLYEREYPRLLRALTAIAGDEGAAEDAVQEAFVRAFKQGLASLDRPGAWLLVVATRVLFRDRRRRVTDVAVETLPTARGDDIDFAIERADLLVALRQLPERQRAVVVARRQPAEPDCLPGEALEVRGQDRELLRRQVEQHDAEPVRIDRRRFQGCVGQRHARTGS
jgi:RNA polymerase sigma factor (sigma-70 family)